MREHGTKVCSLSLLKWHFGDKTPYSHGCYSRSLIEQSATDVLRYVYVGLKNIGTYNFLSAGRLVHVFMIPFPQFTVLPTAHAQFYGQLMVCLSSFRGIVGNLSGYITTCKTLADLHCKAA